MNKIEKKIAAVQNPVKLKQSEIVYQHIKNSDRYIIENVIDDIITSECFGGEFIDSDCVACPLSAFYGLIK